jgi:hypothetical protein
MERVLYNTVLGAKALQPDGHAFYYSDYRFDGRKTYFTDAWPCCSGTLPQVAADYRKLVYFSEPGALYVNLYLPSTVRWTEQGGSAVTLTQTGEYPIDGRVDMRVQISRPASFAVRLRIPAWAGAPQIAVNQERVPNRVQNGFASVQRQWRDGDRLVLTMDLRMRLEPIDTTHPHTVALMRGPLVLMPIGETLFRASREQLLAVNRVASRAEWRVSSSGNEIRLRPFYEIADESYSTYFDLI